MTVVISDGDLNDARATFKKHLEKLREAARSRKALLEAASRRDSADYIPQQLLDLVRSLPSDVLDEVDEALGRVGPPPERARVLDPQETNPAAWVAGLPHDSKTTYWLVQWVLRTVGRELIRDELERFCLRLETYYHLVPKEPHELPRTTTSPEEPKETRSEAAPPSGDLRSAQTPIGGHQR